MPDDFNPFGSGLATATAAPAKEQAQEFNPFATGQATLEKDHSAADHWKEIFSNVESPAAELAEPLRTAVQSLDRLGEDPIQTRKRAILQTFIADKTGMDGGTVERNWDAVKTAYAKHDLGIDSGPASDDQMWEWVGTRLGVGEAPPEEQPKDKLEGKPWSWQDTFQSAVDPTNVYHERFRESLGKFWDSLNTELLPEAPKDLPDYSGMIPPKDGTTTADGHQYPVGGWVPMPSPAVVAGVYNGAVRPLVTPANVAIGEAAGLLRGAQEASIWAKLAYRSITGVFAAQMVGSSINATPQVLKVTNDPNSTTQDKIAAWSGLLSQSVLGVLSSFETLHGALPTEKSEKVLKSMEGKDPMQAAEELRKEAVTSPPNEADALNQTATHLETIAGGVETGKEKIAAAAIREPDGTVSEGDSHAQIREELGGEPAEGSEEGFVTTSGRFIDRKEAKQIAFEGGQLKPVEEQEAAQEEGKPEPPADKLHSHQVNYVRPKTVYGPTALKNATAELERVAYGFPEATKTEQHEMAVRWARAGEVLAKDPGAGERLAAQLKANPNLGLSDDQSALLLRHKRTLENALNASSERAADLNLTPEEREQARKDMAVQSQSLLDLLDAVHKRGSEWGREGRWRRALAHEDYSFAAQETLARAAKGGAELTPEERTKLQERIDELQAKQKELEEHIAKLRLAPEPAAPQRSKVRVIPVKARAELASAADAARARIQERLKKGNLKDYLAGRLGATQSDMLTDLALVAADHIVRFGEKAADKLLEVYGETIKPHLDEVMRRAQALVKARAEEAKANEAVEQIANDPRGEPSPMPSGTTTTENNHSAPAWLSQDGREAWDRLESRIRGVAAKSLLPEETGKPGDILRDLGIVGADLIYHTGVNFGKWSARMIAELGEQVRPHLEEIFKRATSIYRGNIRDSIAKGEGPEGPSNLPTVAVKLARSFIEEGMRDRDQIVDAVHGVLKDSGENITRRDVIDAISGYGRFRPLTRGEVEDQLRDVKGQLLQVAKLTDMAEGKAPLKSGPERRVPSDEERRLIQEVERKKKEGGYEITDPERQLRSSLQAATRAVENRIKDLAERLEKGKQPQAEKVGPTSPELEILRSFRDRMANIAEEIEGEPEETPEDRIERSIRSTTKAIEKIEQQLQDGEVFPEGRTSEPWSPELGALRAKLADLQDFRKQVQKALRPSPSPEEKALAQVKARIQKQIDDLEDQIKKGQRKEKKPKSPVNPDPELEELTSRRDALKEQFNQIFGRKQLTDEQRLNIWKAYANRRIEELQRRMKDQDFVPKQKKPPVPLDKDGIKMRQQIERLKQDFAIERERWIEEGQPKTQKVARTVSDVARASALSGYHTLAKLATFSLGRFAETPVNEAVGAIIRQIPGVEKIAKKANLEMGAEGEALAKFYTKAATDGMSDAQQTLTTGKSDLKAELGDPRHNRRPVHWYDYFGLSHMAEKSPLLRGEFELRLEKGMQWAIDNGLDVNDEMVAGAIRKEAFDYAQRAILQEDNVFAQWVNDGLRRMEQKNPSMGKADMSKVLISAALKTFLTKGIVKTPANYIAQTIARSPLGLAKGTAQAYFAHRNGIATLTPAEANTIARLLKVGSVGSAMFVWGLIDATKPPKDRVFGGYYQPGDKRGDDDVQWGKIRIGNWQVPHLLTHNPLLEEAQIASTFMRVARSKLHKNDAQDRGALAGLVASLMGLASEAPIANPIMRGSQSIERGHAEEIFWSQVTGLIPQLVQNIAQDLDGKSRQPRTLGEAIKATIPFMREEVPETKAQKLRDLKDRSRPVKVNMLTPKGRRVSVEMPAGDAEQAITARLEGLRSLREKLQA